MRTTRAAIAGCPAKSGVAGISGCSGMMNTLSGSVGPYQMRWFRFVSTMPNVADGAEMTVSIAPLNGLRTVVGTGGNGVGV
jgi:hypothetical protein